MTMMQKIQAKKSKKGFTLVELVIVIAILAILAAIAIPVITTTINSAKMSTMESDVATLNMLIKEAINTSKAKISTTKWNGEGFATVKVSDICAENDIDTSDEFYSRNIGSQTYTIVYTAGGDVKVSPDSEGTAVAGDTITGDTVIANLDPEGNVAAGE